MLTEKGRSRLKRELPLRSPAHWLCVTTGDNWSQCLLNKTWGVTDRYARTIRKVATGDDLLIYIKPLKCAGICQVTRPYFHNKRPIWTKDEERRVYPHRIEFEPAVAYPEPLDIREFFYSHPQLKSKGSDNYFHHMFRKLDDSEYKLFATHLKTKPESKLFKSSLKSPSLLPETTVAIQRGSVLSTSTIDESATWGMNQAITYEKQQGRRPQDVSTIVRGYDIESSGKNEVRYIEVKARKGSVPVTLTENEYKTAKKLRSDYYLYVMTNEGTGREIANPADTCSLKEKWVRVWEVTDWAAKGKRIHFNPSASQTQKQQSIRHF